MEEREKVAKESGPSLADHLVEDNYSSNDVSDERTTQTRGRPLTRSRSVGRDDGRT